MKCNYSELRNSRGHGSLAYPERNSVQAWQKYSALQISAMAKGQTSDIQTKLKVPRCWALVMRQAGMQYLAAASQRPLLGLGPERGPGGGEPF